MRGAGLLDYPDITKGPSISSSIADVLAGGLEVVTMMPNHRHMVNVSVI